MFGTGLAGTEVAVFCDELVETEVGIFAGTSVGAQPDIIKLVTMIRAINNLYIFKISPSGCFNSKQTNFYRVLLFSDVLFAWIVPLRIKRMNDAYGFLNSSRA